MCGGEPTLRIERADNGFLIDAYMPGKDGPGEHKRMVASSPEEALKLARPHMVRIGKRRKGRKVRVAADKPAKKVVRRKRA